eukprot:1161688-Pelagomonas_calceolata.AAC.4
MPTSESWPPGPFFELCCPNFSAHRIESGTATWHLFRFSKAACVGRLRKEYSQNSMKTKEGSVTAAEHNYWLLVTFRPGLQAERRPDMAQDLSYYEVLSKPTDQAPNNPTRLFFVLKSRHYLNAL